MKIETNKPIGIIGAMAAEVQLLLSDMDKVTETRVSGILFHNGFLNGLPCVVAQCGAGKVNAAVCAEAMILRFSPRMLINIGVAGGIGADVKIGSLVVGTACVQYDFDTSALGQQQGEVFIGDEPILEFPCDPQIGQRLLQAAKDIYEQVHVGVIATGDRFVANAAACAKLHQQYGALACEMEGASIAHVCYMNGVPTAMLRAVSDNANDSAHMDFGVFVAEAAQKSQRLIKLALPLLMS